jgi:predicted nucleotidyltransferase
MPNAYKVPSIDEIKERLAPLFKEDGLQLALVFGSVVSGRINEKSDIDLAFLFDKSVDILGLTNRVINLLHIDHVDVVDLRRASPLLKYYAVKYCEILFERSPGLFHEFYSFTLRRYVDTKKLRDAQGKAIQYFLGEKGLI